MIKNIVHCHMRKQFMNTMSRIESALETPLQLSVSHPEAEEVAISLLQKGQVIAVPTDTVYGLACSATNSEAINRLYEIKERNKYKPLAICLGEVADVQKWAHIQHLSPKLLTSLLPGPVTLILKKRRTNLDNSLHLDDKIGIRIPDYNFIRNIVNGLKSPIALTSANLSNSPSSTSISDFKILWNSLSCVFDGGSLGCDGVNDNASTIVDLSEKGVYKITRSGVAENRTCSVLNSFGLNIG